MSTRYFTAPPWPPQSAHLSFSRELLTLSTYYWYSYQLTNYFCIKRKTYIKHFLKLHPWIKIVKKQSNNTETWRAGEINTLNSKVFDDKAEDALQHTAIKLSETDHTNDPPTPAKDTRCSTQIMLDNAWLELEEIMYSTKKETSATLEVGDAIHQGSLG